MLGISSRTGTDRASGVGADAGTGFPDGLSGGEEALDAALAPAGEGPAADDVPGAAPHPEISDAMTTATASGAAVDCARKGQP
jgi:hypothetical protein